MPASHTASWSFRDRLRAWLADHQPGPEPSAESDAFEFRREWQRQLNAGGWLGLTWPREYGGHGLTVRELATYNEELALARAPRPANIIGLELSGPTLLSLGTHEQKLSLLPALLSGEEIWCQGFSEPGSGSDLASLTTRAHPDADGWRIEGHKIWTSFAHEARWCMLLARTDPESRGRAGLTCFIVDMHQQGIEVRPIRQITGDAEFNEVFFDGAFAPRSAIVGQLGRGWDAAITTLMHERANLAVALAVDARVALADLTLLIKESDAVTRRRHHQRLAYLAAESRALDISALRVVEAQATGVAPGAESALAKWRWAETNQGVNDLALSVLGPQHHPAWEKSYLRSRANTIEGGTSDILKNIVAERLLHLPRMR